MVSCVVFLISLVPLFIGVSLKTAATDRGKTLNSNAIDFAKERVMKEEVELEEGESIVLETIEGGIPLADSDSGAECLWQIKQCDGTCKKSYMRSLIDTGNYNQMNNLCCIHPKQTLSIPTSRSTGGKIRKAILRTGTQRPFTPQAEARIPAG